MLKLPPLAKRWHKRLVRWGLLAGNLAIVAVALLIVIKNSGGNAAKYNALATAESVEASNPLDAITASEIAANVALMTEAQETESILSYSNIVWTELISSTNSEHSGTVAIPQVMSGEVKTKEDIATYKVKAGDSLESLASKFNVTSNSIRWSNNLTGSTLSVGNKLVIPPVNGVVYKVKAGDTADALAQRFFTSASKITRFNDAEISGLVKGDLIVIPDGEVRVQAVRAASSLSYRSFFSSNITFMSHYTDYTRYPIGGYGRGYCTDWASYRSNQLGNPVGSWGNARDWDYSARMDGYYVGPVPKVGAVLQTDFGGGGFGHVGVVEEVSADRKMIKFSDMNGLAGWGRAAKTNDWIPAAGYKYIYR